jgi:DNA mismatch repair ATPase MutS
MYKISNLLTNKVNNVIQFIRDCQTIVDAYWNVEIPNDVFGCNVDKYDVDTYFQNVSTEPFSLLSNFGSRLKIFKNIKPEAYVPLIQQVYMLDTCWAIKQKVQLDKYAFAKFTSNNVECNMTDMWHPCIAPEVVVHNNVKLGGDSDIRNMIVTGPNAGGKSTLIKAILSNVLLSQTLTIVAAKSSTISPFHLIHSQINIPDCKGKESLFEAEMHRSKESIDMLKECRGPSLIVMDEIFNSTNPIEGISGAYAIAKQIGSYKTNITIISTHYLYLTKLAAKLKHFANYKMGVEISGDDIKFPYKLKKGICKQFIALELLKQNGFDAKIIKDAIEIKQLLTTKK